MYRYFIYIVLFLCSNHLVLSQEYPSGIKALMTAYPDFVKGFDGKYVIMSGGIKLEYCDGIKKEGEELLNKPDISDMLKQEYKKGIYTPLKGEDPGRIRNESFMKVMYGANSKEVQNNLVEIVWCPRLVGTKIKITKVNNVHLQLQKVSEELDKNPELKQYLINATTFNWRIISGTQRLSTHSFGTAIDINVKFSNYWQWDCRCKNENAELKYKNQIPQTIVNIFEKHGFIWGGKWYHYDTMHFEYRPELLYNR